MVEKLFCARVSRDAHEPMIHTAPRVDLWILLEYPGRWEANALEQSDLPAEVKAWLIAVLQHCPSARVQLIRRSAQPSAQAITCFIGVSREDRQALYRFQFKAYQELIDLNILGLIAGSSEYAAYLYQEPLFLVCTNGRHDQCCSKFGVPVYTELLKLVGEQAWQSSHLGGDKFAANMLCLPHGIYYGRVTVPEIAIIVDSYGQGQIYLKKYRGRTCYDTAVQAADYFLREKTHRHALDAFQLHSVRAQDQQHWSVSFTSACDGRMHLLGLFSEQREVVSCSTCTGPKKLLAHYYQLSTYETCPSPSVARSSA